MNAVENTLFTNSYLKDKKIYLSDINSELINAYNVVKNSPVELISNLDVNFRFRKNMDLMNFLVGKPMYMKIVCKLLKNTYL